jgi:lipopolysaccharide export system protein LptA
MTVQLRLGTRKSLLAWAQSSLVAEALMARNPGLKVELVGIVTSGDVQTDRPLYQMDGKDFFVNDDFAKEKSLFEGNVNIDQETKLELSKYKLKTAGIYLMPNGGVTIRDAWNSAIVMEEGNIYLQPANDLVSQPLRHSITKAGGKTSITSKEDIDISSSEGSIRSKAEKMQYVYSNKAGVIIQANGQQNSKAQPDPSNGDGKVIENNAL